MDRSLELWRLRTQIHLFHSSSIAFKTDECLCIDICMTKNTLIIYATINDRQLLI